MNGINDEETDVATVEKIHETFKRDQLKARAERLAEAARTAVDKMEAAGIGFGEVELREALAQWEAAQ